MPLDGSRLLGSPPDPLKILAERKIAAWIESGGPERLSNLGQPLDVSDRSENPFVPTDLRMAYKVMSNAGLVPDWVEIGNDVERLYARAREEARRYHDGQRRDRILARSASFEEVRTIDERRRRRAREFREEHAARLAEINRQIDRFNVACPVAHVHRVRLDVERELAEALKQPPI